MLLERTSSSEAARATRRLRTVASAAYSAKHSKRALICAGLQRRVIRLLIDESSPPRVHIGLGDVRSSIRKGLSGRQAQSRC